VLNEYARCGEGNRLIGLGCAFIPLVGIDFAYISDSRKGKNFLVWTIEPNAEGNPVKPTLMLRLPDR
jgi:hypothetical protein